MKMILKQKVSLNLIKLLQTFFGTKIARAIIAVDWKFKEAALKIVYK